MHDHIHAFFTQLGQAPPGVALAIIALGMVLESMCMPLPSEFILPLAGLWVKQGKFGDGPMGFAVAIIAVTLGCLVGSSLAYAIGYYGGKPLVERFGRFIMVTPHRIEIAEKWLQKFGPWAIVLGRLMFAVRALISLPVGILRMDYRRFILSTLVGCLIWNVLCVSLGYEFGETVVHFLESASRGMFALMVVAVGVGGVVYFRKTHMASPVGHGTADPAPVQPGPGANGQRRVTTWAGPALDDEGPGRVSGDM